MAEPSVIMEVERVMNLVDGFGWTKVKEEIIVDEIHLEIKKGADVAGTKAVSMEVGRAMNLVQGFGWEKAKEEIIADEIHITIKKKSAAAEEIGAPIGPT